MLKLDNIKFINGKIEPLEESRERLFGVIKKNYSGLIRDKLLALFVFNYQRSPSILEDLNEVLAIIGKVDYRNILRSKFQTKNEGLPFYAFELEDDHGKMVSLADLNNKVVIMDFWYTGCINCVNLTEAMAPIVKQFRDNPKVQFVSVNIDKDKQTWLKSVLKGNYTHPESLNLYVGGKGSASSLTHPLVNYYEINAYPTLFILENGKMYSSNPPIPLQADKNDISKGNTKKLIGLINKAIKPK